MNEAPLRARWERAFRQAGIASGPNGTSTAAVGFAFSTYANPDGTRVFPSQEVVAKGLGVSPRTVSRGLTRLVRDGWLSVVHERKPPFRMITHYRLAIPAEWVNTTPETSNQTTESPPLDEDGASTRQERPLTKTETMSGTPSRGTWTDNQDNSEVTAPAIEPPTAVNRYGPVVAERPAYSPGDDEQPWETTALNDLEQAHRRNLKLGEQQAEYLRQRRPHLFPSA
ncbi:helix-turn-helix domain-containing protein [Geodermatophilus saharensis]|uniref:helix-turn-helix domain-containing protein n=1 Tax=Geodermatophilus saharensis TaxID=1137994 RepID=UPI000B77C203